MTGVIKDKNHISVTNVPHFAGDEQVRFKLTVDGQDRIVVDSKDRSGIPGEPQSNVGRTTIYGDLDVRGNMTTVNTTNTDIQDNTIVLNKNEVGSGVTLGTSGIEVERGSRPNTSWLFDENRSWWGLYGADGSVSGPISTIGNITHINYTTTGNVLYLDGNGAVCVATGTTAQRPSAPTVGMLRYNTDRRKPEYYWNNVWSEFGVIDQDQDTYIVAELPYPGSDDDTLHFVTKGTEAIKISNHQIEIQDEFELRAFSGVENQPGYTFKNDTTTGVYLSSNHALSFSTGGNERVKISDEMVAVNLYASGFGGLMVNNGTGTTGWVYDDTKKWWGPYGSLYAINGPIKTIGNINIIDTSTSGNILTVNASGAVKVAVGGSSARPTTPTNGMIRYNTDLKQLEYYWENGWLSSAWGVVDLNRDTFISAEPVPGANDDTLRFTVGGTNALNISTGVVDFKSGFQLRGDGVSVAAPLYSFASDYGTGIALPSPKQLSMVVNGNTQFIVSDTKIMQRIPSGGIGGLEIDRVGANTAWAYDNANNWWGPYGEDYILNGPTKVLGNISAIDTTTSGQSLKVIGTGSIIVPVGGTSTRPTSATDGSLRYNSDLKRFEGYGNGRWAGIGGLVDTNQDTYISPELSPGSNDDTLHFVVNSVENMTLTQAALTVKQPVIAPVGSQTAPAYTFDGDTDTGMYHPSANTVALTTNGVARITVTDTGVTFASPVSFGGTAVLSATTVDSLINKGSSNFNGDLDMHGYKILNTGNITPATNTTYNLGSPTLKWGSVYSVSSSAVYADLAERYAADDTYKPGTVLVFGGENEVTTTDEAGDTRVAGVVSTNPAYRMNDTAGDDITHPFIALRGRVPCNVTGKIQKGDLLVTSPYRGIAMSKTDSVSPNAVFAKALQDHDGGIGKIEVVIL